MIHAAGLDPMKARIEMCAIPTYRKLLETLAEMSDWKGPLGNGKGRGVAFVEKFLNQFLHVEAKLMRPHRPAERCLE